ncbi:LysR substrate-binding domain-containing protein [Aureimonas altamirensis]|uniref:LysR substrate-binding domain-containing protein n=1 Tax=Aureimonas altamirensis TaxID=370622 RepID=UPI00255466F9|nr:LysR substrate-binding domain-containing protein [Aureimonas altamirensis]
MSDGKKAAAVPSTKLLAAFEATGRLGSTVRAGQELNVSHSAISRHIHSLEERLGLKLFERHGSGLRLTNSGRRIYAAVSETFDALRKTLDEEKSNASTNRILVSTTSSIAQGWLIPRLSVFQTTNPAVEIELIASRDLADVERSEIDVIVRLGNGSWPVHALEPLCDDVVYPVCSPDFLARRGGRINLAEMPASMLIHDLDPLLDWSQWLGDQPEHRSTARGIRLHGGELSSEAARRGLGIALVRHLTVIDDIERGSLVTIDERYKIIHDAVWIGGSRNSLHKTHVRRFREWIRREADRNLKNFMQPIAEQGR